MTSCFLGDCLSAALTALKHRVLRCCMPVGRRAVFCRTDSATKCTTGLFLKKQSCAPMPPVAFTRGLSFSEPSHVNWSTAQCEQGESQSSCCGRSASSRKGGQGRRARRGNTHNSKSHRSPSGRHARRG